MKDLVEPDAVQRDDGSWLIAGSMPVDDCHQPRKPPLAKIGPGGQHRRRGGDLNESVPISGTALFEFRTVAANISELFRPLEKPPLAALTLFVCCR
jgi:hypothetical protein